jgi:hypothetical protein
VSGRAAELSNATEAAARYRSSMDRADPALQELRLWMMRPPFSRCILRRLYRFVRMSAAI